MESVYEELARRAGAIKDALASLEAVNHTEIKTNLEICRGMMEHVTDTLQNLSDPQAYNPYSDVYKRLWDLRQDIPIHVVRTEVE